MNLSRIVGDDRLEPSCRTWRLHNSIRPGFRASSMNETNTDLLSVFLFQRAFSIYSFSNIYSTISLFVYS